MKKEKRQVQEYLRMAREATIDKENLDYLNHHKTFYIYDMTDNLQYWMIVVEKEYVAKTADCRYFKESIMAKNERENRYLEKFWNDLVFSKEKGKYYFKDGSTILLISFFFSKNNGHYCCSVMTCTQSQKIFYWIGNFGNPYVRYSSDRSRLCVLEFKCTKIFICTKKDF
ncbi:hypothetical protein RFI_30087 [Reticulomyxa filosa]|uniref:Uncharacterized protein n=1 Tax=Reticulomyxa filosa TaxID=46433 RepID=X6M2S3_RETFI|nr:hypothetical protein RFI_30087 [Reticulomyxa filosa]|eukprot:ETO07305.1 hypothetical protein RFI_30087 [Reticulomyxa filosa]